MSLLGVVCAVVGLNGAWVEVAGVVGAEARDADLVHFGEIEHCSYGGEPAAGVAERAEPVQVHPGPGFGGARRRDMIGQAARVGQAAVGGVVEGLAPPWGASPIHCDHREPSAAMGSASRPIPPGSKDGATRLTFGPG